MINFYKDQVGWLKIGRAKVSTGFENAVWKTNMLKVLTTVSLYFYSSKIGFCHQFLTNKI